MGREVNELRKEHSLTDDPCHHQIHHQKPSEKPLPHQPFLQIEQIYFLSKFGPIHRLLQPLLPEKEIPERKEEKGEVGEGQNKGVNKTFTLLHHFLGLSPPTSILTPLTFPSRSQRTSNTNRLENRVKATRGSEGSPCVLVGGGKNEGKE